MHAQGPAGNLKNKQIKIALRATHAEDVIQIETIYAQCALHELLGDQTTGQKNRLQKIGFCPNQYVVNRCANFYTLDFKAVVE